MGRCNSLADVVISCDDMLKTAVLAQVESANQKSAPPDMTSNTCCRRHGWHMKDKVPLLQRLRWGQVGFANLRHQGFKVQSPASAPRQGI